MFAFSAGDFSAGSLIGASVYPILWVGILWYVKCKLNNTYTRLEELKNKIQSYQKQYAVVANKSKLILGDLLKEMQTSLVTTRTFQKSFAKMTKSGRSWRYISVDDVLPQVEEAIKYAAVNFKPEK